MARPTPGKVTQQACRIIDGVKYFPVLYHGKWEGYGTYMAGQSVTPGPDGTSIWELYRDRDGKPIPYSKL